MPRAVTPTARAKRSEEEGEGAAPLLLVEEVEEDDDDDFDDEEEPTPSIRSRSVTSHQGPIVLTFRSMPRSKASRCTSAKVSRGAGGGGEEEEEGEEEEASRLADLLC